MEVGEVVLCEEEMPEVELFIYKAFSLDWCDDVGAVIISDEQKYELLCLLKEDLGL